MNEASSTNPSAAAYELNPSHRMYADNRALWFNWYEFPREDPAHPDVHTYTDALAYDPGSNVAFHASTTAATYSIEVVRDGSQPRTVYLSGPLPGSFHATPKDAYREGCGWPIAHTWRVPESTRSGFYKVISRCATLRGETFTQYH